MVKKIILVTLCLMLMVPWVKDNTPTPSPVQAQDGETLTLAGLQAPVTVIFDAYGVPHIYAENAHDLFMAQGYLEAQDRFWQMDWWRRFSSGRQAEVASDYAGFDSFIRTLDFQRAAEQDFEVASDEAKAVLQAYADGVNAYISENAVTDLAVEYQYLADMGVEVVVGPWTPFDSLRWLKMMAFDLSGNFFDEIERAVITEAGGPLARLLVPFLFPEYNFVDFPVIIEPGGVDFEMMEASYDIPTTDYSDVNFNLIGGVTLDNMPTVFGHGVGIGSNSWVIGGALTDSGMPYLADDPHLGIQLPSIWYEVGLHCTVKTDECPYDVVGVGFAGFPGVIIGHNDRIAWGFTNVGTDVQDLYMLQLNPDNPDQYLLDGEWVDFELKQETIVVNGAENREITVRRSVWGPVLSDIITDMGEGKVFSLRWTALDPNTLLDAVLSINRAQNWDDFQDAMRLFDVPAQNVIYADVEGNIGYQMPGKTPIRAARHDPRFPVDGSTTANAWQGYVPFEELPSLYNPETGYIVTANNSVVGPDYPHYITADWSHGYRAMRIETLIQNDEDGVFTLEDVAAIHGDNYNAKADYLIPALQAITFDDPKLAEAIEWLSTWDRQNDMDSGEAALFEAYWAHLIKGIFYDDLGTAAHGGDRYWVIVGQMIADPNHPIARVLWGDDPNVVMATAFADAYAQMVELLGDDPSVWRWGALHLARFTGEPLGYMEGYEDEFQVVVETSGGGTIVNATGWSVWGALNENNFELQALPSMRQVLTPQDWDMSLRINTLGQSGNPSSPHFADQVEMWRNLEYRNEPFTREAVEADASRTLILTPAE